MRNPSLVLWMMVIWPLAARPAEPAPAPEPKDAPRAVVDDVGFCTRPEQIEAVVRLAKRAEGKALARSRKALAKKTIVAAVAPHDDHLYAGRVYLHVLPAIASARTVIVFGVTHRPARKALGDPQGKLILDTHKTWHGPFGPVAVDDRLRGFLAAHLPAASLLTSDRAHDLEHSIEAMVPWLQFYNRQVRIVPIMVTGADRAGLEKLADALADALAAYLKQEHLALGQDLELLVSTDTTHYGPDFDYAPFGVDAQAHAKGTEQDQALGRKYLSGPITPERLAGFEHEVWDGAIPWCGRYSVPLGLLTAARLAGLLGKQLTGIPLRYGDSYSLGVLPAFGLGLGTTAPFSLKHWVGYWALAYALE